MVNDFRWQIDFSYGTLSQAISVSDTVLNSGDFAALPDVASGTVYIPITLTSLVNHARETVWITSHVAGSSTATVVRGKEGTTAVSWASGTPWVLAPTTRDITSMRQFASLPTDGHAGQRVMASDKGEVLERTYSQGWLGYPRGGHDELGRALDGTTSHANGLVPIMKAWTVSGTTNASGRLDTTIPNGGFPTRLIAACLTRAEAVTTWYAPHIDPAGTSKTVIRIAAGSPNGSVASSPIAVSIIAIGV